jgi:hypothetical protein
MIDIPPTHQLDFPTSPSLEKYTIDSDSMPADALDYISCKSEEPSPRIPFHPSSFFSSFEEAKDSLLVFQNPLYNAPLFYPIVSMAATGGGGGGVLGGGGGGGGQGCPCLLEFSLKYLLDMHLWSCLSLFMTFLKNT